MKAPQKRKVKPKCNISQINTVDKIPCLTKYIYGFTFDYIQIEKHFNGVFFFDIFCIKCFIDHLMGTKMLKDW